MEGQKRQNRNNLRNNFQAQNVCDNESVILLLYTGMIKNNFKNNYLLRF